MKKNIYAVAFVAMSVISVSLAGGKEGKTLTPSQIDNIEALSDYESGGGDRIPCYSSSRQDYNRTYVDCSNCTRYVGWKGEGTEAACTTR